MKLPYYSLVLVLLSILSTNLSNGADPEEDILSFCYKMMTFNYLHSTGIKNTLDTDEKIIPISKMCQYVKNISYSLELLETSPLMNLIYLKQLVIRNLMGTNKQCILDVGALWTNLKNGPNDWPLKMLDASGKPLPGILNGAVHWPGDFNQCTSINMPYQPGNISEDNPLIRGQYCTMHIAIPKYVKKLLLPSHMDASITKIADSLELKWDFCSTQHCSNKEHEHILEPIFDLANKSYGIELINVTCKHPLPILKDNAAIATLALIGVICIFLFIGTLYDILCCPRNSEIIERMSITNGTHFDQQYPSYYNNTYEADSVSCVSSINSFYNQNKDEDDTENKPTLTSIQNTEMYLNIKPENNTTTTTNNITRSRAPVAPTEPSSQPETETPNLPSGVGNSISDLNSNQNANSFEINGHIPSVHATAESDIFKETSSNRTFGSFLLAFSIRRNAYHLLNTEHPVEVLSCLNGIRFMSMAWIILGHTYQIASEDYIKNLVDGIDLHQSFTFQAVLAAPFAVDTFFLLSGTLVTYLFLEDYYCRGIIGIKNMLLIYVRRYLRLTPCYAVILMFYTCLLPNLIDGPYWKPDFSETCHNHWWTNLLYINNIYKLEHGCMSWTWYLANDMQFFIISPIILCQFVLLPSFAFLTIIMMFGAYVISSVILWQKLVDPSTHSDIYTKPWCRISPFLIGIILGYFLQQKSRKRSFPKFFRFCGWIFAASVCVFLCYIKYTMNRKENPVTWLNSQYTAYEVVSHPLWAMAISWVIIICASGNGGIISDILSWKFWIFLSRLTYCAYLIHPIVILVCMRMSMTPLYLSVATSIYAFISNLTISYGLSFIVSLFFEMPIRMLEKTISKRK